MDYIPLVNLKSHEYQRKISRFSKIGNVIGVITIITLGFTLEKFQESQFVISILESFRLIHPKIEARMEYLFSAGGGVSPFLYVSSMIIFPVFFVASLIYVTNAHISAYRKIDINKAITGKMVVGAVFFLILSSALFYFIFLSHIEINDNYSSFSVFILTSPVFVLFSASALTGSAIMVSITLAYGIIWFREWKA